jgi:CheY-like chemotaxis protein
MASILVVDDEPDMCLLLQVILEAAGHKVTSTIDPREVTSLQAQHGFDVAIVDIVMPRRDGVEVVRDLRKDYPGLAIVAMSGANPLRRELFLDAGKLAGADASFGKPYRKMEILASVDESLKQASLRTPR